MNKILFHFIRFPKKFHSHLLLLYDKEFLFSQNRPVILSMRIPSLFKTILDYSRKVIYRMFTLDTPYQIYLNRDIKSLRFILIFHLDFFTCIYLNVFRSTLYYFRSSLVVKRF